MVSTHRGDVVGRQARGASSPRGVPLLDIGLLALEKRGLFKTANGNPLKHKKPHKKTFLSYNSFAPDGLLAADGGVMRLAAAVTDHQGDGRRGALRQLPRGWEIGLQPFQPNLPAAQPAFLRQASPTG